MTTLSLAQEGDTMELQFDGEPIALDTGYQVLDSDWDAFDREALPYHEDVMERRFAS